MYNSKVYKRSRVAYVAQCTVEYFVMITVTDTYLAKILSEGGVSDIMTGIISSFITIAFLCQMVSFLFAQKIKNIKRTVMLFSMLSVLLFTSLYLIPLLPLSVSGKTVLVMMCILVAYFANYFVAPFLFKWANSFVAPDKRGEYSASKEMVSLFGGMIFTLVAGYIIDYFEMSGQLRTGFLVVSMILFVLSICNFLSLMLIKAPEQEEKTQSIPLAEAGKHLVKNKNFINVIILTILWNVGIYITTGYLGVYKIKELQLTVGMVQLFNVTGSLCRLVASRPFGRYSDKHSYAKGMKLALVVSALAFGANVFTTPKTWWMIAVYTILHAISMAGINQNTANITYSYVESDYLVQAMAIKNSIGGICGFLASLAGGAILSYVQDHGNMVLGVPVYGQQVLSLLSFGVIVALIIFIHLVIEKQKVMRQ